MTLPPEENLSPSTSPASRVNIRAQVAKGTRLVVTVEAQTLDGQALSQEQYVFEEGNAASPLTAQEEATLNQIGVPQRPAIRRFAAADIVLWLAVGVYLLVRLIGLASFPIYFFTDEAVQTVLAGDLVRDQFRAPDKEILPTYFNNVYQYNLSTSVYIQVIPVLLFPRSIETTRATAVLFTLIAAVAAGLILRNVFRSPYPWLAVLILSMTPAWLLHSRTAFETALAVSFYAGFLYLYMMYRKGEVRYLYGAIVLAALSFYSYSPAQVVVAFTALLLFVTDFRYHWHPSRRRALAWGLGLVLLLAVPYVRFLINHPDENVNHLRQLGSYWSADIGLVEKLGNFIGQYLHGLDPQYWYFYNTEDFSRHRFGEYGHLFWLLLPFGLAGVYRALRRIRQPEYRTLLIALLAAPSGAALVQVGVTRALFIVVPMALLSALAFSALLEWMVETWNLGAQRARRVWLPALVLLVGLNGLMITDALVNGPVWFKDYGLNGMQYGARQVFAAAGEYMQQFPKTHIIMTPSWANGTDVLLRFFYPEGAPFELGNIDGFLSEHLPLDENTLFIMIPEEYDRALASEKFKDVRIEKTLPYPDGQAGFLFVRLSYVDNIDEILAREQADQRIPEQTTLDMDGQTMDLVYSRLDMGSIDKLFDGNTDSLVRTLVANPLRIEMTFSAPRTLSGLTALVGGVATEVTVKLFAPGGEALGSFSTLVDETPDPRDVEVPFDRAYEVQRLILEVRSVYDNEPAHVHLWEVRFK
ncbi:MAG TPA: glycosyltransferase family 39 protein [Anaerolineaceae bacterium]|nr:glycosyltransferase family 39 protein [Anaerolineaceae bacterium]